MAVGEVEIIETAGGGMSPSGAHTGVFGNKAPAEVSAAITSVGVQTNAAISGENRQSSCGDVGLTT